MKSDVSNVDVKRASGFTSAYSAYVIALLAVINIFNYMDRMVLSVLMPAIKAELGLSDAELGWLTGLAFALFYATVGIPVARIADLWIRKYVIAASVGVWSVMTMSSGMAANFVQLLLARIGVGAGESGCIPTAHSIVSDITPKEKRAGALSFITAGSSVGIFIGLGVGGWLSEQVGWRWTFVLFGAPGILLVLLTLFTLREPERLRSPAEDSEGAQSFMHVTGRLLALPTYRHLVLGFASATFVTFGFAQWLPTFYSRTFDLSVSTIGLITGLALGGGMTIGAVLGGLIANRLMVRDMRWGLWISIIGLGASMPLMLVILFAPDYRVAFAAHLCQATIGGLSLGPLLASIQAVVRSTERAMAQSLNGFLTSLIGFGGGPAFVGYLSDFWASRGVEMSLKMALACGTLLCIWPIWHFIKAGKSLRSDLRD
jgi:predicted MFS family arabinose efflux permease